MKVTFSDTQRDFAGWVSEKCGYVLQSLCAVIRDYPDIVKNDGFQDALDNTLKLFAMSNGNLNGIYCSLTYTLLIRFDLDGYYFLEDLINNTKSGKIMRQIMQSERDEEILKLIEANNRLNRTALAELLAKSDHSNKWIATIIDDIEYVHDGSKTWEWFYDKHCNDRNTFIPQFSDDFIRQVYEYFNSDT